MALTTAGLIWLIVGVACFLFEMAMPGFIVFFFGVGAWITAISSWLMDVSLNTQLAIFLISSLVSLFTLRGFIRKTFLGGVTEEKADVSVTAGDKAEVLEDILPHAEGRVFYSGTQWRAVADEKIDKGTIVTIISQDGLCMKVTKAV